MNATKRALFPFNCRNRLNSFLRNPILNLVRLFNNIKPTFTKKYLGPRRRRFEPERISRLFIHKATDMFIKKCKRLVFTPLGWFGSPLIEGSALSALSPTRCFSIYLVDKRRLNRTWQELFSRNTFKFLSKI